MVQLLKKIGLTKSQPYDIIIIERKKREVIKMIISNFVDNHAWEADSIIDDFKMYLETQDGSTLTKEQELEIRKICEEHPIITILCAGMYEIGYDTF
jgi:hypothetical protein